MLQNVNNRLIRLALALIFSVFPCFALANIETIEVVKNNSKTITVPEKIKTMIIGNPAIAKVVVLNPDTLIINALVFGNTSLTLIGKSGNNYEYKIQVTHDLGILRDHLKKIDSRITANSDPNGDAIILAGFATNQSQIYKAEEAALRYFGNFRSTLQQGNAVGTGGQGGVRGGQGGVRGGQGGVRGGQGGAAGGVADPTSRFDEESVSQTTITSQIKIVNLIVTKDSLKSEAERLESLLKGIDERISVENVNNVLMLKGKVKTGAALSRALSIADRFVTDVGEPDFMVVSDRGGVLAGNTDELQYAPPPVFGQGQGQGRGQGGGGLGGQGGGGLGGQGGGGLGGQGGGGLGGQGGGGLGGQGGGGLGGQGGGGLGGQGGVGRNNQIANVILSPPKGNIAQNVQRGDVVMVGQGRIMSVIKVDSVPRVEMQMRIVGVDRSKTEEFGIDWSLATNSTRNGKSTSVRLTSLFGQNKLSVPGLEDANTGQDLESALNSFRISQFDLASGFGINLSTFIRWIQSNGSGQTLTEPLLTALSGESTNFNVGGTLPIITTESAIFSNNGVTQTNQQTVTYLPYGLGIVVRPTVLENGKISIVLDQILSEPDFTVAATLQTGRVPGFTSRTVNTITETDDGETWAVAGLLNEQDTVREDSIPYLSNLPYIGWLFKKENKGKSRRELLLVVTARVIGEDETQASQNTDNNLSIDKMNEIISSSKQSPLAPKKPAQPNNAQSLLQKQPSYTKPAKPRVSKPVELIP